MSDRNDRRGAIEPAPTGSMQLKERLAEERPRLVGLCASLTNSPEAAEDLAQETLVEAWRHRDRVQSPDGLPAWTSAIARNVCKRWVGTQVRESIRSQAPDLTGDIGPVDDDMWAGDIDLEVELERRELANLLDRAMEALSPQARAVLVQRYVEDRPHGEIAERLGLSEGAVRGAVHRGKLAMRRILATDFPAEAAAYGLPTSDFTAWQETRMQHRRLQGGLQPRDAFRGSVLPGCPVRSDYSLSGLPSERYAATRTPASGSTA